jgi:hypothetical protein
MFCPRCEAEYRPGFTRCSDCGVDLVDSLEQKPARRSPSADDAPVVLCSFVTPFEASIAQASLRAAGIESVVRSDDAGGTNPSVAFSQGTELLVRSKDAAQAREVLAADDASSR